MKQAVEEVKTDEGRVAGIFVLVLRFLCMFPIGHLSIKQRTHSSSDK